MQLIDLIIFVGKLFIALFIVRFHVNLYRLGFNPIVAKLNRFTDLLVMPFRRIFPPMRYDIGAVIVAFIISLLIAGIVTQVIKSMLIIGVFLLISTWLNVVMYAIFIMVIASWLQTDPRQPVLQIALSCTEWLIAPLRRIIPPIAGLDFSPMAALFLLIFLNQNLYHLLS